MFFCDQDQVNKQQWNKIRRIKIFLAGEDYLKLQEPTSSQKQNKKKNEKS